jgi:hypothetical protein
MPTDSELPIERGQDQVELKAACEQLAEAIDADPAADAETWVRDIQAACRTVFKVVSAHREAAEGDEGVMAEIVSEKPGLLPRTNRLVHEHVDMLHRAMEIDEQVERQVAFQQIEVESIQLKASVLRDITKLHLMRASDAVYDAFFQEEGGEAG